MIKDRGEIFLQYFQNVTLMLKKEKLKCNWWGWAVKPLALEPLLPKHPGKGFYGALSWPASDRTGLAEARLHRRCERLIWTFSSCHSFMEGDSRTRRFPCEFQCVSSVEKETIFFSIPEQCPMLNHVLWTDILPSSEQLWILKFILLHRIYISFVTESHIFFFPLTSFFVFSYFCFPSFNMYCYLRNHSHLTSQSSASLQNVYSSFSSKFLNCSVSQNSPIQPDWILHLSNFNIMKNPANACSRSSSPRTRSLVFWIDLHLHILLKNNYKTPHSHIFVVGSNYPCICLYQLIPFS